MPKANTVMPELNEVKCGASTTKTTRQQHEIYCPNCGSVEIKKRGKTLANRQRWACKACGKTFVE